MTVRPTQRPAAQAPGNESQETSARADTWSKGVTWAEDDAWAEDESGEDESGEEDETPFPPLRPHPIRWTVAVVLGLLLTAHLVGGWYFSDRITALLTTASPQTLTRVLDTVVVGVRPSYVTLRRGPDAGPSFEAPASYGLSWAGGTGHVGPAVANPDGTVTRTLDLVTGVAPMVGQTAVMEPAYYTGDPSAALGLPTRDVVVAGMAAWFVPAATPGSRTVAIFVPGRGASRMDGLRFLETAHAIGLPVLLVGNRTDTGVTQALSGRLRSDATQWRDVDAAVAWSQAQGMRRVVLAGQSTGAAMVAAFLEHSPRRTAVARVVLDSPVLSPSQIVEADARSALPGGVAVPATVLWVAQRVANLRHGIDWSGVDYVDDTSWLRVPTLVLQGRADTIVPVSTSERLRNAHPRLVTLVEFPKALHGETWNTDRGRWSDAVGQHLRSLAR